MLGDTVWNIFVQLVLVIAAIATSLAALSISPDMLIHSVHAKASRPVWQVTGMLWRHLLAWLCTFLLSSPLSSLFFYLSWCPATACCFPFWSHAQCVQVCVCVCACVCVCLCVCVHACMRESEWKCVGELGAAVSRNSLGRRYLSSTHTYAYTRINSRPIHWCTHVFDTHTHIRN